jgi:hypothetical protein
MLIFEGFDFLVSVDLPHTVTLCEDWWYCHLLLYLVIFRDYIDVDLLYALFLSEMNYIGQSLEVALGLLNQPIFSIVKLFLNVVFGRIAANLFL